MNSFIKIWIMALLSFSVTVKAENWQKIISCENGAAYLDVNQDERRDIQLVFKGEDMLGKMRQAGFASPNFGDREFVRRGSHAELQQVSATETRPGSLGGVFYPQDFKKMIWSNGNGSAIEAESRVSELILRKYSVSSGSSCSNYDQNDGMCRGDYAFHQTYYFNGEYILKGCFLIRQ